MIKTVVLPKQNERGKLSIVRPGDAKQSEVVSRQLAAQEDFLRTSSAPCLSPAPCICEWDGVSPESFVPQPSGRVLSSMGRFSRGKKFLSLEEMLYLSEAHAITVYSTSNDNDPLAQQAPKLPMSREEVFSSVFEAGLSSNVYMVYAHLKRLGYILRRHFDRSELRSSDGHHPDEQSPLTTKMDFFIDDSRSKTKPTPSEPEAESEQSNNRPCRQWWKPSFGPVPSQFSQVRVRVKPHPDLVSLSSRERPQVGETLTSIIRQNSDVLLACYDVLRPGKRVSGPPDMLVLVATSLPSPSVLRAVERCAKGRPVRIACCPDTGGLAFYSSEAYVVFA